MSSISIIGTGNMASALAGRALAGATVGTVGTAPDGDIVIPAVPYASAAAAIGQYGDALDGKVVVDITNPITPDFTGFLTPEGTSGAHEIAKAAPHRRACRQGVQHLALRRSGGQPRQGSPTGRVHRRRRRPGEGALCRSSSRAWDCAR